MIWWAKPHVESRYVFFSRVRWLLSRHGSRQKIEKKNCLKIYNKKNLTKKSYKTNIHVTATNDIR